MLARVRSATISGIEAATIFIEVDVTSGLPSFSTVGFPDSTGRENRDRVRAAVRSTYLDQPREGLLMQFERARRAARQVSPV